MLLLMYRRGLRANTKCKSAADCLDNVRVLLVHPEDSPRRGPWSGQRWDLLVDLGRSSPFSASAWEERIGCPVLRADSFRRGIEDLKLVREVLAWGRGQLIDDEGIDWWDLMSLEIISRLEDVLVVRRLISGVSPDAELFTTRPDWPASAWSLLLNHPARTFSQAPFRRWIDLPLRYAKLFRRFSTGQIKQIFLDKYDAGYRWRSRFVSAKRPSPEPVVLLPSAYENVSLMAAAYAELLPKQQFLLVASRQSARGFVPPGNVQVRDLADYTQGANPLGETASLLANWEKLKSQLFASAPEYQVLMQAGLLDPFPHWFREFLRVRDAWREVIEREPVSSVLCGDDSNVYTRLPVLLAARRKIPTVDFHHGSMDGRYMFKELPCDAYLTKTEMERDYLVRICGLASERLVGCAPSSAAFRTAEFGGSSSGRSAILFSEAYEVAGLRAEEVYREILPRICDVARKAGRGVILKLHPFESAGERKRLVQQILSAEDAKLVSVVDAPTTPELLSLAWFGITIESTTVLDCLSAGVPGFLCGWLTLSSYGYGAQYARFGIGEILSHAEEIGQIPQRLKLLESAEKRVQSVGKVAGPEALRQLLAYGSLALTDMRRIS